MSTPDWLWLIGRALLGGLFVVGGVRHFWIFDGVAQAIAARGLPFPRLVLAAGTAFEIAAGALLILGLFVPYAALGLIVFTVLASLMLLNFWSMEGAARDNAISFWQSNMAIVGGLLVVAARAL